MRLQHVDMARGICILLVALGHNQVLMPHDAAFNHWLGTIRMPLLFLIAGTFFQPHVPLGQLARLKADTLLKPFLVMALLHAPLRIAFWHVPPLEFGLGVLSGSGNYLPWLYALWFLPHLWLVFLLAWLLHHGQQRLKLEMPERLMVTASLLAIGFVTLPWFWMTSLEPIGMKFTLLGLPFSADLLPISTSFFMLGYMVRRAFHQMRFRGATLVLALAVFSWTQALYHPEVGLFDRRYSHLFACTVAALSGTAVVLELASWLTRFPSLARFIAHCGINSLFILMFHSPIQSTVMSVLDRSMGAGSLLAAGMAYVICVGSSLMLAKLIRRHWWLGMFFLPTGSALDQREAARRQPAPGDVLGHEPDVLHAPMARRA